MKWSERKIAAYLARWTFNRKCLVVVPNCSWTGNECDVLAVTQNLRIIDIEIKISRADLKADAAKDKWFHDWDWKIDGPRKWGEQGRPRRWPRKVWKHYYAVPDDIWAPELAKSIAPISGVLLFHSNPSGDIFVKAWRGARPQKDAERLDAEDAIDIARLASLRMWDAFDTLDERVRDLDDARKRVPPALILGNESALQEAE